MAEAAYTHAGRPRREPRRRSWPHIFWIGLVLWALAVIVTFFTGNANLVPTIVLLGSFLVPVTFVAWAFDHRVDDGEIDARTVLGAFLVGGVIGVLGASVLETYLLHPSAWTYIGVGLIEEGVKLLVVVWFGRHIMAKTTHVGMILGGTVGFGFAAFESAGYALSAAMTVHGISLREMVETEILRGILAPVGHGLWTAILGGVLFAAAAGGHRYRFRWTIVFAYAGVAILHALWDSMHGIAAALTLFLTGRTWQFTLLQHGYVPDASGAQALVSTVIDWAGLIVISLIAIAWLLAVARHRPRGAAPEPRPPYGYDAGPR
ncbi:MAG TPA: PrsW family glutamic-type intramembrane protease [Streptosporangiaceae bacterium]|jgi:RsiW-degrading membrane proteinase PrsW (M82 family)